MVTNVYAVKNGSQHENAYFVVDDSKNTIIIDPGVDLALILDFVTTNKLVPILVLATHGHWDHISAVSAITDFFNIPFSVHPNEKKLIKSLNLFRMLVDKLPFVKLPSIDIPLEHNQPITVGGFEINPFLIGSHTPGSVLLLIENHLFTGDILFKGSMDEETRTSNPKKFIENIEIISNLADDIIVYPGHGPKTWLKEEMTTIYDLKK